MPHLSAASPDLEQIAEELQRRSGAGRAPDALELARAAGLAPVEGPVGHAELTADGTLRYREAAQRIDWQRWVVEELAGWLLRERGFEDSTEARHALGAALLLPKSSFGEEADASGWDLRGMRDSYPNTSMGTMAYRLAVLHGAVATWFDHRRLRWRRVRADYLPRLAEPTRFEQHLAEISFESETTLNPEPRIWAFPLNFQVGAVLLACDAERLLDKL